MAEFDESKHPRDKDGKFTDKNSSSKNIRSKKLLKALTFFAENKHSEAREKITIETAKSNFPKQIFGFENGREKTQHHQNHIIELGYKDEKQYQKGAIEFWNNKDGKTYFSQSAQRYYKYDAKKELFLSSSHK